MGELVRGDYFIGNCGADLSRVWSADTHHIAYNNVETGTRTYGTAGYKDFQVTKVAVELEVKTREVTVKVADLYYNIIGNK